MRIDQDPIPTPSTKTCTIAFRAGELITLKTIERKIVEATGDYVREIIGWKPDPNDDSASGQAKFIVEYKRS